MKLPLIACLVLDAAATLQLVGNSKRAGKSNGHLTLAVASEPSDGVHYGDERCPCIGFDNIEGETLLMVERKGKDPLEVSYPADLGARCEAWDDDRHFLCKKGAKPGLGKGWCAQHWCYVDPCKCDIDVLPKISISNTEATYRGKPLFWSYATCGGKDMFTVKKPEVGLPKCRCIGFAGVAGTTEITFKDDKMAEYPADLGTSCSAWDKNHHPQCEGDDAPSWCRSDWCYVDPCDCELPGDLVPKISAYLPEASFTGKNIYYSYETCGSADTWTEKHHYGACVNQDTKEQCATLSRCSWTGTRCLGSELVNHPLCKDAKEMYAGKAKKHQSGTPSYALSLLSAAIVSLATLLASA